VTWLQTHSDRAFDFEVVLRHERNRGGEDLSFIDLHDIAVSLSRQPRFLGHMGRFYSVAEHSCLVMDFLREEANVKNQNLLACALMHDASEAYMGDLPAPLKHMPQLEGYRQIEQAVMAAISARFGLTWNVDIRTLVKWADSVMLRGEAESMKGAPPRPWFDRFPRAPSDTWLTSKGLGLDPEAAKLAFLGRAQELFLHRGDPKDGAQLRYDKSAALGAHR